MVAYLWVMHFVTTIIQGTKSGKAGDRSKEDLKYYGTEDKGEAIRLNPTASDADTEAAARWRLIVQNNVENLPIAMAIALFCPNVVASRETAGAFHIAFVAGYCIFRTAWTVSYAFSAQPWRTIFFFLALLCELGFLLNGVVMCFL